MTHHMSRLSRPRTAGHAQTSSRTSFALAAPTAIAAARASTALAMSMTVALRYLEGHPTRAVRRGEEIIDDPALC